MSLSEQIAEALKPQFDRIDTLFEELVYIKSELRTLNAKLEASYLKPKDKEVFWQNQQESSRISGETLVFRGGRDRGRGRGRVHFSPRGTFTSIMMEQFRQEEEEIALLRHQELLQSLKGKDKEDNKQDE